MPFVFVFKSLILSILVLVLGACAQQNAAGPDLNQIKNEIRQQFHQAYGGLAEISALELSPAKSELNNADHRVYDVKLTAVVTDDLQARLDQLPDTMENKIMRGRIKGMMTLGAVHKGQKLTARLRALVERNPQTGQWQVVGLIRSAQEKNAHSQQKDATP